MRIYGHNYAETRSACEYCGFSCFDDEIRCPNCGGARESLLSEDVVERERRLKDYYHRYRMLQKAAKRGWVLFGVLFALICLVTISASVFFQTVQTDGFANSEIHLYSSYILAAPWILWLFLLGQPGLQCSRAKDIRYLPLRFARGPLRWFRDGRIAEFVYAAVVFAVVGAIIAFYGESQYVDCYYKIRVTGASEELYASVGVTALHTINFLWFAWHILSNLLCPYDYKSELKMRLQEWRKLSPAKR
jgi:hypothetical protein